jgi:hypothetical protein
MHDDLLEHCELTIERHVDIVLADCERLPGSIESMRGVNWPQPPYEAELRRQVLAAVRARERFERRKPDWAPILPFAQGGGVRNVAT